MKIVVVGGSGVIGSRLITLLARDGHEVVFRAYKHERPLISGARRVPGAAWSQFNRKADILTGTTAKAL